MKLENLNAKSIVKKEYFSVKPDDKVQVVFNKMMQEELPAVPVIENNKITGTITWRQIIRKSAPPETKVRNLMLPVTSVSADKKITEVAELFLKSGVRIAVVYDNDEILGIITQIELLDAVTKDERFAKIKLENFISPVVTINEDDTIGKAKALMRENRIARLPVVNNSGQLTGSVDFSGVIKSLGTTKSMKLGERKGDSLPERDSPVTVIRNRNPVTASYKENIKKVVQKMVQENRLYTIITRNDKPVGILTPKDIIEQIASLKTEEGAYIHIAGGEDIDDFERSKIFDIGERAIKKAARMFGDVENLIIHIKKQNTDGGKSQYMVRSRIFTSKGLYVAKEDWNWSLIDAVDSCAEKLEKRMIKDHEKKIDSNRRRQN